LAASRGVRFPSAGTFSSSHAAQSFRQETANLARSWLRVHRHGHQPAVDPDRAE
jgi:hypothetical protein